MAWPSTPHAGAWASASARRRDLAAGDFLDSVPKDADAYVVFGARERTEDGLRKLLNETGFRVERVVPTSPSPTIVAEAV